MQGLLYPAVLGSCIVFLMYRILKEPSFLAGFNDISIYFAIIFSLFFSISYLINEQTAEMDYRFGAFCLDICEIAIMYSAFNFLQLVDSSQPASQPRFPELYALSIAGILIQNIWNFFAGERDWRPWSLSA